MQKLRELTSALVLVAMLSLPTVAGEIHIPGPNPPDPPPVTAPGDIHIGDGGDIYIPGEIQLGGATQGPSSAADLALNLLQELLLVF